VNGYKRNAGAVSRGGILWHPQTRAPDSARPPHRHQPGRSRPRFLSRLGHDRRRRAQDGPALDAHRDGEHARTHCLPRLLKVIEGESGGISQAVGWTGGGGFRFLTLGAPVFEPDGRISPAVRFPTLAGYLWFLETGAPWTGAENEPTPLLGIHEETAVVLLYNGILGDRRPDGGNVLTSVLWRDLESLAAGQARRWIIYGEAARMPETRRRELGIQFKQIPYDIRMR
jgi:adenine-specific DNA-methyltransferase